MRRRWDEFHQLWLGTLGAHSVIVRRRRPVYHRPADPPRFSDMRRQFRAACGVWGWAKRIEDVAGVRRKCRRCWKAVDEI